MKINRIETVIGCAACARMLTNTSAVEHACEYCGATIGEKTQRALESEIRRLVW